MSTEITIATLRASLSQMCGELATFLRDRPTLTDSDWDDYLLTYVAIRTHLTCYAQGLCLFRASDPFDALRAFCAREVQQQIKDEARAMATSALWSHAGRQSVSGSRRDPESGEWGPSLDKVDRVLLGRDVWDPLGAQPGDLPVTAAMVVSEQQARRSRELLALAFRRRRMAA